MADDPSALAETQSARDKLRRSERSMELLLEAFDDLIERLRNGENVTVAEMSKTRSAMIHVRSQLVDEVNKYEESILFSEGLVEHAPLDLDAIRRDVGRRLDRLRGAE